ncbi:MAG TPA: protein kinase [Vicinamibacterales bacterium]|nr:protein kinase [Vicinamibacterales bacterium]
MIETVGRYRILEPVGRGLLGGLYRARDTSSGRTISLRIVSDAIAGDDGQRQALAAAARVVETISHPNVAVLYELVQEADRLALAWEFVPGATLAAGIGAGPINPRLAAQLAAQMADALAETHAAGLSHGRLDPRSVIVTPKGSAKLIDVGFARWSAPIDKEYAAPELAAGSAADERADIFALGGIVQAMITGRPPRPALAAAPAPSDRLGAIVLKARARNAEHRWQSAAVFAAELRAVSV